MKKLLVLFAILFSVRLAQAATTSDAIASFKAEAMSGGQATILNNAFAAYVHDVNNGDDGVMAGSSFYQWGPFTADAGMVAPTDKNRTGTPLVGASLHFDRLLNICAPQLLAATKAKFPISSQKFLPLMYVGAAPVYNWNAPDNQKALNLDVWTGLEFAW